MTHYKKSDGSLVLNVRENKIVSIEYYYDQNAVSDEDNQDVCLKDLTEWTNGYKETAESIKDDGLTYHIYEGVVSIVKTEKIEHTDQDAESDDSVGEKYTLIGAIVVNS